MGFFLLSIFPPLYRRRAGIVRRTTSIYYETETTSNLKATRVLPERRRVACYQEGGTCRKSKAEEPDM